MKAKQHENNLAVGDFDKKIILDQMLKDYQFNKKSEKKITEYVYEVVYLINTTLPRVGTVMTEAEILEFQNIHKINFEIKSSKATIVRQKSWLIQYK